MLTCLSFFGLQRSLDCALANHYLIFVDEERCQIHGGCSQECSLNDGVYTCKCAKGYELTSDNKTCRALGKKWYYYHERVLNH